MSKFDYQHPHTQAVQHARAGGDLKYKNELRSR